LHQENQSIAAVVGTHLALCLVYLAIDLFKYRRMSLFLFKSYETLGEQLDQISPPPPSNAATKINSNTSITYVPVERQPNWANVLGDIRNFKGGKNKAMETQMIDGIPIIRVGPRTGTYSKIALKSLESEGEGERERESEAITVPRLQSASTLPQRRGSADTARIIRVMKASESGSNTSAINISRGRSAVDVRKKTEQEKQSISVQRTLTQAQISGILRSAKGNFIEDQNGKVKERILIRRKRSAPNKDSLNLPPDFHPEVSATVGSKSGSTPSPLSRPLVPPMEKISEADPAMIKVEKEAEKMGVGEPEQEENVIKLTRTRGASTVL
jgi:hypothetical protein